MHPKTWNAEICTLPADELESVCTPEELRGEMSLRNYWQRMNQMDLEIYARFDKNAAAELARRKGELSR